MATCGFCNHTNPYSTMPVISASQHPDVKNQLMHSSYSPATAISSSINKQKSEEEDIHAGPLALGNASNCW
ncbi:unnamed protein product [Brassica rapa subsp. trilocularis]